MKRIKKMFRQRQENERGAAFVLTAVSMVLLLWAGATGVDVGFTVYGSRQAQAMADTAALDLARYISYADTLGSNANVQSYLNGKLANVLTDNGSNAQLSVIPGYFASGVFTPYGYHGGGCAAVKIPLPGTPGCNAIEVTANQSVPQIFFGGFNVLQGHSGSTISGSASGSSVAAYNPEAGFSIGSYLLSLNTQQSAVLNAILGPLGSNVSLTAVGYQGLATANVTLAQLISARPDLLTTSNIMSAQLTAAQWLSVYTTAVGNAYGISSSAYTQLNALNFSNSQSTEIPLCSMLNVNALGTQFNCGNSSISQQGLNASANVLQLLTTEAELANGTNAVNITSALNLSSPLGQIGTVTLKLTVIQPAQVAYGPVGTYTSAAQCPAPSGQSSTCASTAQVQATLNVSLLSLLGISIGTLSIPLTAASGTATLSAVTCVNNAMTATQINASTTALTAGVTLNGLNVATLSVNGVSNASAPYSANVVPPTSATQTAGTNPVSVGTTTPTLSFSGLAGLGLTNLLVNGLLNSTSVLSEAIGPVLQAVGVQLAGADIADLSANCDAVSLAQ